MSSSQNVNEASSSSRPAQQLPPFASWPTIKILEPPKGQYSRKTDEWCFTYTSQSIYGRYRGNEPTCRSICIRKVFAHEVKNIIAGKTHRNLGPDGKAMYPLPAEGQSANIPRWLGGKPPTEDLDDDGEEDESHHLRHKPAPEPVKYWDEGWYLWTTQNRFAIHEKLDSMKRGLAAQEKMNQHHQNRRELWQEYQEHLEKGDQSAESSKWWGPIVPPRPFPDYDRSESLLLQIPPETPPFWNSISKLLGPTQKALNIFHESIKSGEQREFAARAWEKACSAEPFNVAIQAFSIWAKLVKDAETSSGDDKKST
ncbi:hypothetical protein H0H92_000764 [Tricholoma furcatifolium]|nr:hypothetical protein H0H92_000764 [Tricholoma furcatifolium]